MYVLGRIGYIWVMKKIIITIGLLVTITIPFFIFNTNYEKKQQKGFGWVNLNENCNVYDFKYQQGDSLLWNGNCNKGNANGVGVLKKIRNNNLLYNFKGSLIDGVKSGIGQENYQNGLSYNGKFYYDFHGKGILEFHNSKKSEGIFVLGTLLTGVTKYANGDVTYSYNYKEVDLDFALKKGFISREDSLTFLDKEKIKPEINKKQIYFYDKDFNRLETSTDAIFSRTLTLTSENIPKNKLVQDFWPNGNIQSKYYVEYVDVNYSWLLDVYNGTQVEYYESGKPSDTTNYVMGKLEGPSLSYTEDGLLKIKEHYKNDEIETRKEYYVSGNVKSKRIYNNKEESNNTESDYSEYYDGGKKRLVKRFQNDNEIPGHTIEYFLDGSAKKTYKENFYLNKKKWLGVTPGWEVDLNENLVVNNDELVLQVIPISYNYKNDYSIQIEFEKNAGENLSGSGMVFNYLDNDNYMKFLFSSDGYFSIYKISKGITYSYVDWRKLSTIEKENLPNKLKINKNSKTTTYYINNQLVYEHSKSLTNGNEFGFVADKGKYLIKKFEFVEYIKNLEPEPESLPKDNIEEKEAAEKEAAEKEAKDKSSTEKQIRKEKKIFRNWNSSGSGVVISEDGMIATNNHVIEGAKHIEIELENDNGIMISYNADIIKADETNDLAIIKINDNKFNNLSSLKYNFSSKTAKTGSMVYALGFPYAIDFKKNNKEGFMGKEIKFTDGRISARTGMRGNPVNYQTTVPLQPGNSGGPLFDKKANLIGINVAKLKNKLADNVSYSIKSLFLKNLIDVTNKDFEFPSNKRTGYKTIESQIEILRKYVALIKIVK